MYCKDVLPNGVRVITEYLPQSYSVTTGIWVDTGSAYEKPEVAGVSHFLEHMLFKGTKTRTAKELAEIMEDVGAQSNAFTSKEYTCYYVRSLPEYFEKGLDVLADMYINSTFDPVEFDKEKGVILEEINMYEDTPEDLVNDIYARRIWPTHTYGRPIIGTIDTVSALTRDQMYLYYKERYTPEHTIIVVSGNIEREKVLAAVNQYFAGLGGSWDKPKLAVPETQNGSIYVYKDIEQVHINLGLPSVAGTSEDVYKLNLLSNILGGGVTSRLFQQAREERGLTYSIYSGNTFMVNAGSFYSYASTSPQKMDEVLTIMGREMAQIAEKGVTDAELQRAQAQVKCGMLMSMENTANIMVRFGKSEAMYGYIRYIDEIVERLMAVTVADVQKAAQDLFKPENLVLAIVGPSEYKKDIKKLLG